VTDAVDAVEPAYWQWRDLNRARHLLNEMDRYGSLVMNHRAAILDVYSRLANAPRLTDREAGLLTTLRRDTERLTDLLDELDELLERLP
jgi:hypothetical protein